ncbi:hypothetical protein [Streptomyces tanashiensis]|uniref:hypothetical protein n=1 Tax=Streptomyces tanashiensis TaxID=67367 RepID=UPI003414BFF3
MRERDETSAASTCGTDLRVRGAAVESLGCFLEDPERAVALRDCLEGETGTRSHGCLSGRWPTWLRGCPRRSNRRERGSRDGWNTSRRRTDANGVLMPMRLDIQVDWASRTTQLTMNSTPDQKVAKPRVGWNEALLGTCVVHRTADLHHDLERVRRRYL